MGSLPKNHFGGLDAVEVRQIQTLTTLKRPEHASAS